MRKGILLTKKSFFQIYATNYLFSEGIIAAVVFEVGKSSFPKKKNIFPLKNPRNLEKVTRVLFSNKRKMINKNFKKLFKKNDYVAKKLNIDLNLRPEQLSSEMYYKIAKQYEKLSD